MTAPHRARSHDELLGDLLTAARYRFADATPAWDPARPGIDLLPDHGRGLLDVYAAALHVLWTYQQAWADEGFLGTARLPGSGERLLELVGLRPDPGTAATGLQSVRCRQGGAGTIPEGFAVRSRAVDGKPAQTYETLRPRRVSWRLNELRPFLPPTPAPPPAPGAVTAAATPRPGANTAGDSPFPATSTAAALTGRLQAARAGTDAQRRAALARQQALRLADLAREISGDAAGCTATFDAVCARLTEAATAGSATAPPTPGPLSESQETLLGVLARLAAGESPALAALDAALRRADTEDDADYAHRLDQAALFLDGLVAGLAQHARDQVVLLHGREALRRIDAVRAGPTSAGFAAPGCDTLFLHPDRFGPQTDLISPGDWLVLRSTGTDPAGAAEAIQVSRVRQEVPPGRLEPMTAITFRPPLRHAFDLAGSVLLGNVVEISHGATVREEVVAGPAPVLRPTSGPLTWLRDPAPTAEDGRVPAIVLEALGREWRRVDDLTGYGPGDAVHTVETEPDRGVRLRSGDGRTAAALTPGTPVVLRYRVGTGPLGDQPTGAVADLAAAHPAVLDTTNPLPITGGVDPEPIERARSRARAGLSGLRRAVSAADVAALASTFGGIRAAAVTAGAAGRRRALTVVVVAESGDRTGEPERDALRAFLQARTPPGTTVTVLDRRIVPVRARLRLVIAAGGDPLAVLRSARARLGADPADPADPAGLLDPRVTPLGRDLTASDLYRALDGVPDLAGIVVDLLARDDLPPGAATGPGAAGAARVAVGPGEIACWAGGPDREPLELSWSGEVDR